MHTRVGPDSSRQAVAEATLVAGSWFAMEQAGRLLANAVQLCDAGEAATGLVLAMFMHEELGRSKLLREAAYEVSGGASLTAAVVRKRCSDHVRKHAAGALSLVFQPVPGEPLYDVLLVRSSEPMGSDAWLAAEREFQRVTTEEFAALPKKRHDARMGALYVDLADDGQSWLRPAAVDATIARNAVNQAAGDYVSALQFFNPELAMARHARGEFPGAKSFHAFKPAGIALPSASWPRAS